VESIASGYYVGMMIDRKLRGLNKIHLPEETMLGSLFHYCSNAEVLKPMYANFGLLPVLRDKVPKKKRRAEKSKRGLMVMKDFIEGQGINWELKDERQSDV